MGHHAGLLKAPVPAKCSQDSLYRKYGNLQPYFSEQEYDMKVQNNLFLIGFMGAGKSAVAAGLHRISGYEIVEMDKEIELSQGKRIPDIFREDGEPFFRQLETDFLKSFHGRENCCVSCGKSINKRLQG